MPLSLASLARDMNSCTISLARPGRPIVFAVRGLSAAEVERVTDALGPWPHPAEGKDSRSDPAYSAAMNKRAVLQDAAYIALASDMVIEEGGESLSATLSKGQKPSREYIERFRSRIAEILTAPEIRKAVAKIVELSGDKFRDNLHEDALGKSSTPPAPGSE